MDFLKDCVHCYTIADRILGGVPIRYGQAEPWKVVAAQIGRTKPTRANRLQDKKRKKNDGRPPDTIKELVQVKVKRETGFVLGPASYPWKNNSCWLDTSLELTLITVMRHFLSTNHLSSANSLNHVEGTQTYQ